jgi:peptide/nickel transport system permease protein
MAVPMNRWRRLSRNRWLVRLLKALLTVYSVTTITFFRVRLLPGNPTGVYIQSLVQQYGLSYQEARNRASLLFAINLNQPIGLRCVDYILQKWFMKGITEGALRQ